MGLDGGFRKTLLAAAAALGVHAAEAEARELHTPSIEQVAKKKSVVPEPKLELDEADKTIPQELLPKNLDITVPSVSRDVEPPSDDESLTVPQEQRKYRSI